MRALHFVGNKDLNLNVPDISEDPQQPGMRFKIPMLSVLDALKSSDPALRRVGETWMRCNLGSYPRFVEKP